MKEAKVAAVGVVVIGRNEGDRLRRCLASVLPVSASVVYVDSGSTDSSVMMAAQMGACVVELDMSLPFCAARARNAGYQRLIELDSSVEFVQFVDGDCELLANWLVHATDFLVSQPKVAIVVGWLHEKSPEKSIYNRMGDLEWNLAGLGELDSVGGIFTIRRAAFDSVGGFDPTVAAGEEPELCQRLKQQGWQFWRIDREMALHDLAMMRFSQWYRRHVRTGYNGLDVAKRFGLQRFRRITNKARVWALLGLSAVLACLILYTAGNSFLAVVVAFLAFGVWVAQLGRIAIRTWRNHQPFALAVAYGFFTMISFWPQCAGQMMYWRDRIRRKSMRLVEHKSL